MLQNWLLQSGACMVNDISAGSLDENMFATIAKLQVPYVLMHMVGTPQTMQQNVQYENLIKDMIFYFSQKIFTTEETWCERPYIGSGIWIQ